MQCMESRLAEKLIPNHSITGSTILGGDHTRILALAEKHVLSYYYPRETQMHIKILSVPALCPVTSFQIPEIIPKKRSRDLQVQRAALHLKIYDLVKVTLSYFILQYYNSLPVEF